jgi:hypothetical protein
VGLVVKRPLFLKQHPEVKKRNDYDQQDKETSRHAENI